MPGTMAACRSWIVELEAAWLECSSWTRSGCTRDRHAILGERLAVDCPHIGIGGLVELVAATKPMNERARRWLVECTR